MQKFKSILLILIITFITPLYTVIFIPVLSNFCVDSYHHGMYPYQLYLLEKLSLSIPFVLLLFFILINIKRQAKYLLSFIGGIIITLLLLYIIHYRQFIVTTDTCHLEILISAYLTCSIYIAIKNRTISN